MQESSKDLHLFTDILEQVASDSPSLLHIAPLVFAANRAGRPRQLSTPKYVLSQYTNDRFEKFRVVHLDYVPSLQSIEARTTSWNVDQHPIRY